MSNPSFAAAHHRPALAVILGTNEIASAVAVHLHRAGFSVVMSHDPLPPPVLRRGMAFNDVLWGDSRVIDGVGAVLVECGTDLLWARRRGGAVAITSMGLVDLLALGSLDLLVDGRMLKYAEIPVLRHLAEVTIGLGPEFTAGVDCDAAVETRPARTGLLLTRGSTDAPDGISAPLGGVGGERFVRARETGVWRTALTIGTRVYRDMVVGHLGRTAVRAPMDGALRGLVRDGTEMPAGAKLIEIDPRDRRHAGWTGIDERGRRIAEATTAAALELSRRAREAACSDTMVLFSGRSS